ncbi:hypothetical protein [Streptococcus pluranimalium]|uniref:hypothetical protein n=1 Tax=Streptococcus pluranimalium TaxID=82348 RepID=UPI003F669AAD
MRNWTVIGKYPVYNAKGQVESTVVQLQATEPSYASFSETVKGDYTKTSDVNVIGVALEAYFNAEYVDRAMGEAVEKVQAQTGLVEELKEATQEAKTLLDEVKAEVTVIRNAFVKATDLPEDIKSQIVASYPTLSVGDKVEAGQVFNINGQLMEAIKSASMDAENFIGDLSLFKPFTKATVEVDGETLTVVNDFVQPTGAHDVYKKGDRVTFEGKVYESVIDNNAYSPTAYQAGWKIIDQEVKE